MITDDLQSPFKPGLGGALCLTVSSFHYIAFYKNLLEPDKSGKGKMSSCLRFSKISFKIHLS